MSQQTSAAQPVAVAARRSAGRGARRLSAKPAARQRVAVPFARMRGAAKWWWLGADLAAIVLLAGLLLVAWLPTFGGGWLAVTVFGGTIVGLGVGLVGWRLRWNSALVGLAAVAAWFGFGGLLAMPSATVGGVLPNLRALRGLATGPVTAPKAMLTLEPPIGETFNLLTVPLLFALVAALAAISISLRSRRPTIAWLPPVLALAAAWLLGTSVTRWPIWVAIAAVAIVVVWTSARRRMIRETLVQQGRRTAWLTPLIGAGVLVVAGGLTWAVADAVAPEGARRIVRHRVQPPLDINHYATPLQQFRGQITMNENTVLFTVSGMQPKGAIRVATMDLYDGLTYAVTNSEIPGSDSGQFTRVGRTIADPTTGTAVDAQVTIAAYRNPWVPTVGQTTRISFAGPRAVALSDTFYYNRATGTGLSTAQLGEGDSYTVRAVVPQRPADEVLKSAAGGSASLPLTNGVPDTVKDVALRWTTGAPTKGEAMMQLEKALRQGYFSHGQAKEAASLSGHSYDRVQALLANPDQMIGDEEQYAVTMALMARQLGVPARVVYGFQAPESGSGEVRGRDVRAWTEVQLEGLGWVLFNPTPDHDRIVKKVDDKTPPRPRPHVDNPPPPAKKPKAPPADNNLPIEEAKKPPDETPIDWRRIGTVAAIAGIPAITLFGPLVLIVGLKARRRLQRRNHPSMPNRFAGAWSELVDHVRDLGRSPSPTATRSEQAEAMVIEFAKMIEEADPIALAKRADSVVFSPDQVTEEQATSFWATMKQAEKGVRRSVSPWAWLRSRLSTRSFRRYR